MCVCVCVCVCLCTAHVLTFDAPVLTRSQQRPACCSSVNTQHRKFGDGKTEAVNPLMPTVDKNKNPQFN